MNYDGRGEKIAPKEADAQGALKEVENIFVGLLEGKSGVKVSVRKSKIKLCKKRGIFEAI